ncbi:CPBP family intramembrane glutamic endopeptidase [Demequina sp. NBRC 110052]|uniref:CPBP family intramembrane glutamic endopeptidase n=1 Tax=Demequina sp. NBRC 110052 TaxID=1570341 RepID=UPI0013566F91|nr:CPBP family intramembrane glutamic endopeptidase [Demequina sp. NBRC 110052]
MFDLVRPSALVIALGVVAMALANAAGEELVWRGALLTESRGARTAAVYAIQVVSFGAAHWHGIPGLWKGVLLTGIASLLFLLVHRRWGIVASIIAHAGADIALFFGVLPMVLFTRWSV